MAALSRSVVIGASSARSERYVTNNPVSTIATVGPSRASLTRSIRRYSTNEPAWVVVSRSAPIPNERRRR